MKSQGWPLTSPNLRLNGSWKGTTKHFLYHFNQKLQLLDSLVPSSERLPDSSCLSFLKIASAQVPGAFTLWMASWKPVWYQELNDIWGILWSPSWYSLPLGPIHKQNCRNCHVQVHEVDPFTDELNFDEPEDSSPPLPYEVYMTLKWSTDCACQDLHPICLMGEICWSRQETHHWV